MQLRRFRLRFRRNIKKRQRQANNLSASAEDSLDRYVVRRLVRLLQVKRFLFGWIGLLLLISVASVMQIRALGTQYLTLAPSSGGIFREGVVGTFTNANPLYAQTEVDVSASKLMFSGLMRYNNAGVLSPDLAEKYEVNQAENEYKFYLRDNLKWHDGKPITSKDVVFTFKTIQNPEAKSYLLSSWKGVTVSALDDKTVVFKLKTALSAFPHSLTIGILPEHILSDVSPPQLRSSKFNNENPIGSGPFKFQTIELDLNDEEVKSRLVMVPNDTYHFGSPSLGRFVIRAYQNESSLYEAFKANEVDTMVGLDTAPEGIDEEVSEVHRISLSSQVMVFFRNNQEILKDPVVRKALVLAVNKQEIIAKLGYPAIPISQPLLPKQIGYDKAFAQPTNLKDDAVRALEEAGWKLTNGSNIRTKEGKPLKFKMFGATNPEFTAISSVLQKQWRDIGIEVEVNLQSDEDLQASVNTHNYDSLMYGISVGADPDVYVYWHGTQGDIRSETRLNLSEYKSASGDKALEAGRTRSDAANRALKYKPFLEAWQKDYPALALYQQQFMYVTIENLDGFNTTYMHTSTDRYSNVHNWTIKKTLQKTTEVNN